jgi:hemerythrin-like metal-binding protein
MATTVEYLPWNASFETGIPEIDSQHQRLVELVNALASHLAFQSDAPTLIRILDELEDYVTLHFRTEEAIWHRHLEGDALEVAHGQSHEGFVRKVRELRARVDSMSIDDAFEEILSYLSHWLAIHILEADRRMALVVRALDSGASLDAAKGMASEAAAGAARTLVEAVMTIYDKLASRTVQLTREINRRQLAEHELNTAIEELRKAKEQAQAANLARSVSSPP